jgi:FAD/FMN-containing dehydrogenase
MADVSMTTSTGSHTVIEGTTVETFKASLRGELLRPGDTDYDEARTVWNGMIDKRPGLIARCTGVADVISAVDFARTHQLLVSVRGGGHNIPGNAVCNGGLMIDLARMRSVRVDPVRRTARAEGGVTWGEFDHETQVFGLATTGGSVSDTGIAGLTLGGGLGWLAGKCGLSCDNLLSADVVQLGNAANRVSVQATAFSHRDALCEWGCLSSWVDPAEDGTNIRWTRELAEAMQPFSSGGAYITQLGVEAEEGADRIKDAYGPNYERLAALKNKYDPTNLFRHNQNIRPAR